MYLWRVGSRAADIISLPTLTELTDRTLHLYIAYFITFDDVACTGMKLGEDVGLWTCVRTFVAQITPMRTNAGKYIEITGA